METRIREADFIKGIAILGVILIHVTAFSLRDTVPTADGGIYLAINQISRFSVPVFFMLSGLFLFHRYYGSGFSMARFLKKRARYILVPYLIWSVFYVAYAWTFHPETAPHTAEDFVMALLTGRAYYHLYFVFVMVQFYLILPVLFWGYRRFGGLTMVALALMVYALSEVITWWDGAGRPEWSKEYTENAISLFPTWLFYFCLGGWLGQRVERLKRMIDRLSTTGVSLIFGSMVILTLAESFFRGRFGFYNFTVSIYSIASLILWFQLGERWKRSWVAVLGRYSYGLYLVHPFLLNLLSRVTPHLFPEASWQEFSFMLVMVTGLSWAMVWVISRMPYGELLKGK
ncbi:acyltransferase [Polycladomyces sp. WAk]|uniref:Acyltransferase n=1 Tax=Polycladomyces zharkentensis TaxID=2807616 RepID=A0ABS2WES9_9BACL|nr:acyltransferase [Polycladomyces sp. WAk]MBN2907925.1 acyltransferase [Polycladomyces sp. WAk]